MSDVNANIRVNVSTQEAQAQLAALQQQMNLLNKSMTNNMRGTMDLGVGNILPQLKGVHGEIVKVEGAASRLNKTLAKGGTLRMGQAFANVQGAMKGNAATMELARRNAAELGTQYTLLGKEASGALTVFKGGQMAGFNMDMAVAAQRSAILTRTIDQMGTSVLNWGKNMQWAGRQLMVGFTVPITIFSALAIKSFQDVEREIVNLRKVYGDFNTTTAETDKVTAQVRELASELTRLGFTAKETLGLASDAAALGFQGQELLEVTTRATEMAALGMMTQAESLNTIISLNSAFGVSVNELSGSLDFLNAVENETVLTMQDMSEAIPITATAVQGLGGDVKDLAVFMVAMREGGINANEAANALKTSLARLITPTRQASETAAGLGINLERIVAANEGDLMGMIQELAGAMESLSDLQKQQLLSDVFGKRQFARMGALFNNINKEGTQAARTFELLGMNAQDLASITQKELSTLEESPVMQLNASIQKLQASLAPIGEMIASVITPVIEKLGGLLDFFNKLPDTIKQAGVVIAGVLGVIVPGFVMLIGLLGNFVGTMLNGLARLREYATGIKYMSTEEIGAQQAAAQLNTEQMELSTTLQTQSAIVAQLATNYDRLVASMSRVPAGGQMPGMPMRFATGGRVPGSGNTDKIPALLTPGEYVINKKQSQKHSGFLKALNAGSVRGFSTGYTDDVVDMIAKGKKSGFDEARVVQILKEAGRQAGISFADATKANLSGVLTEWGYAGHGGRGVFNTEGTQNSHLAEGGSYDFDTLHVDKLSTTSKPGQELRKFKDAGGFTGSPISGRVTGLTDFTSHLGGGSNQGSRQGKPLNAESWHAAWTADEEKTKAAFRDQAKALLDAKKITDQEYLQILASIEQSYDTVGSDLARLKSDTTHGPGGKMMTETEMGDLVQTKMQESGGGKLVDILTQEGVGARMDLDVPDEIKAKAERSAAVEKELDKLIAKKDAERSQEYDERIASLQAEKNALEQEGYFVEEYDGKESRSKPGSKPKKKQVRVARSVSGMPEGFDFVRRNSKFEVRTSADGAVAGQDMTRQFMAGSGTGAKFYQSAGKDAVAIAQETEAELRRIAERSGLVFEDIEQTAREAGVSVPEALAEGIRQNSSKPEIAAKEVAGKIPDAMNSEIGAASPARETAQVGKNADDGLAQGIRENAQAPVREARNVGEQMELAFDEGFDGYQAGADQMQEAQQGTDANPVDPNAGQMGMFGDKKQMAGMIGGQLVSMAAFTAPSMLGDKLGEETGKMMQSIGMLSGQFMSFASMLAPPMGAIAGALIGATAMLGSALYGMWRDHQTKISEEAYALGSALGGAADAADKMAAVLGRSTAASRQALKGLDEEAQEVFAQFANAFEDGAGKAIVTELQQLSGAERTARAQEYLNTAVANKMISEDEIDAFAKALGAALSDSNLASNIVKDAQRVSEEGGATRFIKRRAQERDAAIRNSDVLNNTDNLKGYMSAYGAASQGMKQWSEVSAIAREDYLDGVISYNEYMKTLKEASDAQREYSQTLYDLIGKSPDAKATIDAISNSRVAAGLTTAEQEKAMQDQILAAQDTARYGEGATRGIATSPFTAGMGALQNDVTEATKGLGEFSKALGGLSTFFGATIPGMIYGAKDREKLTAEGMTMAETIHNSGVSVAESYAIAAKIIGDADSDFSKAYKKTIDEGGSVQDALARAQITSFANDDQGLFKDRSMQRDKFMQLSEKEGVDPQTLMDATAGMDIAGITKMLAQTENLEGESLTKYVEAMKALNDVAGPQTKAAIQDTMYALSGDPDSLARTNEQLSDLAGHLNNNDEMIATYIEYIIEKNGRPATEEDLAAVNGVLEDLAGMDKEYLLKIGIDVSDPTGASQGNLDMDMWDVDRARQAEDYVMSQAAGWAQDLAAAGVAANGAYKLEDGQVSIDETKQKTLNELATMSAEINDAVEAMGDDDIKVQKEATIDFIVNSADMQGIDISQGGAKAMIDNIIADSGIDEATFYSMPADDIAKTLNFAVIAEGAAQAAKVFREAARVAWDMDDTEKHAQYNAVALSLEKLAKSSRESITSSVTSGLSRQDTTKGTSGGGGGGGKKDNWYTTLFEDEKASKDMLKRTNKLLKENRKIVDENSKLNREVIDALAADEEAYEDYQKDVKKRGRKKANQRVNEAYFGNMKRDAKQDTVAMRTQKRRENLIDGATDLDYFTKEQIKSDEKLLEMYEQGGKARDWAIEQAEKRAEIETTELDRAERRVELQRQENDLIRQGMDLEIKRAEYKAEDEFFENTGTDRATINQLNEEYDAEMRLIQLRDIKPIQNKIDAQRDFIRELEREYEINEDNIKAYQKQVDDRQRIVEDMQRALELRQREGEMLDHDLKLMSYIEEDINKTYDERIEALDKVASINEQIAQSQQDQLGLADALSRGDIGAAAQAAQQMQQSQMQFAADQYRNQLEVNKENAINNLTGAESGLTREQIEERQRELEEDSYQTNLKIRAVEDEIYDLNMKIRDENDVISAFKDKIEVHNKNIRDYEWEIYDIENGRLKTLEDMKYQNDLMLAGADLAVTKAASTAKIELANFDRQTAMWEAEEEFQLARARWEEEHGERMLANLKLMRKSTRQANEYYRGIREGKGVLLDIPKLETIEFKSMEIDKAGLSTLTADLNEAFNNYQSGVNISGASASYNVPTTAVPQAAVNGIMGNVTNNYNNNNVNVNAASANAQEVAQIVLREINLQEGRNIK